MQLRADSNLDRTRRWLELGALLGLGPVAIGLGPRWAVLPGILLGTALCLWLLLRDPTFDRRQLWDPSHSLRGLGVVLARAGLASVFLFTLTWGFRPEALFVLPREHTGLWALVMVGYPVFSVYGQEVIFRTFLVHRHAEILGSSPRARVASNALIFGWAHVAVLNLPAIFLSALAGALLASTYLKTRSTLLVAIEHSCYGCLVFSVGLGDLFYNTTGKWSFALSAVPTAP